MLQASCLQWESSGSQLGTQRTYALPSGPLQIVAPTFISSPATSGASSKLASTGDRVIEKWKRPKKTEQPGWYHVLQIVVPGAYIPRARPMQSDDTRAIKWVRAPALRERLTFAVLIAPQLIQLLQLSSDQIVCGELQLLDDGAALVVAEYTKATPQDLRAWHETLAEISNLDELPLQDDGGESILQRVNVTLHPTVYDIPVSKGISFK